MGMSQKTADSKIAELRQGFSEYLKAQGKKSYGTTVSDAFYLYRNSFNLDFLALLDIEEIQQFQNRANELLKSILREKSSANGGNIGTYASAITQLWKYIHSNGANGVISATFVPSSPSATFHIPRPSCEEVERYLHRWNTTADLFQPETVLKKLFTETHPKNNSIDDIILKVAALNTVYNTYIYSVYPVAQHILSLKIDERLSAGDETLVNELMRVLYTDGGKIEHYSFATKYCSFHNPDAFPIYDSYVGKILQYYRNQEGFSDFKNSDLKNYPHFKRILSDFRQHFGLEKYTTKEFDQYLWQFGKEYFK